MGRLKGSLNKNSNTRLTTSSLSSSERIRLVANIIIDRILEDQRNGQELFKKIQIK